MHSQLQSALEAYRRSRRFDPARYVEAKSALINKYLAQGGIRACVVGVSGGVDSAVTLGIITHASRQPGSPIQHVLAALLPMHAEGATNQSVALKRGSEVTAAFEVPCVTIDLSGTLAAAREASWAGAGVRGTAWASGQLVSYLRTPMLYYQAALLAEQGLPAVVCGTTNRDEGSYIGFFGKASDGMVDLQPISDLHKSEVYQLAALLGVPHSVQVAIPTGDTYNGACDEEMINAPYDALELYTWYLCANTGERGKWRSMLCVDAGRQFETWAEALEKLHQINHHKYIGDSPAVHLDLYTRIVPGGWRSQNPVPTAATTSSLQEILAAQVGPVQLDPRVSEALRTATDSVAMVVPLADFGESALLLRDVLGSKVISELLRDAGTWRWVPADRHGKFIPGAGGKINQDTAADGSYRATAYDEEVAGLLWDRLAPLLPSLRMMDELCRTDWNGHCVWRPVGINPMLRFIRYEAGGLLVPHYDAGYDFQDGRRHTLMSVVFTLTPPSQKPGGNTRLLLDPHRYLPMNECVFMDRPVPAAPRDVLVEVFAGPGDALVFDHRLLHDGSTWQGPGSRILLRTDIIFERCAPHALKPLKPVTPLSSHESWAKEPTVRKAYETLGSVEDIEEAGYFEDGLQDPLLSDPRWWTAPFDKILDRLTQPAAQDASRELLVLVSTGAFCPVHAGHLDMMEQAKRELEERGKIVLGGYLAPDHDDYVSMKCGQGTLLAARRVDLCERAVLGSDWLMVEHWAALHAPTAANFTTVIERIQKVLAYNLRTHRPIQVVYVFGSDNARFATTFVGRGTCVCVLRPEYEKELETAAAHPAVRSNRRIIFSRRVTRPAASTNIRNGDVGALPDQVKHEWLRLRSVKPINQAERIDDVNLYIRNEGDWAVQPWAKLLRVDSSLVYQAYRSFSEGLRQALGQAFSRARKLEGGPLVHIIPLDLGEQKAIFETLTTTASIISLDPCLTGLQNIAISRCFAPLSNADPSFVSRPGAPPLDVQLACIPDASFVLFDDDSFSGNTAAHVRRLLESRCTIEKFATLYDNSSPAGVQQQQRYEHRPRLNLLDCRDFLAGAREGGLVLSLPDGTLGRAPYVLPYVRPYHRASVPVGEEIKFSRRVWELNKRFFTAIGTTLCIDHMSFAYRALCSVQGFERAMTMVDLCEWHIQQLLRGD